MHIGILYYDSSDNRYGIRYKNEYGEQSYNFHCGDSLDINLGGTWVTTRFEMGCDGANDWYLVGIPGMPGLGSEIRI